MNSNPPLFLVVKFKNVNKKSKTITDKKKHDGISLLQFDNTQNAKNIKRKGPAPQLVRRHYYFKNTSKQQNIVKSYAKKAKNEYLFKKKKYFILQGDILKTCENNKKKNVNAKKAVRKNKHIEKKH